MKKIAVLITLICFGLILVACVSSPEKKVEDKKPAGPVCGDGKIEGSEQCEAALPLGKSCQSLGYAGGTLMCKKCRYDQSKCVAAPKKDWNVDRNRWRRRGGRGSCPYVYLFDGERYRYHTDLSGSVLAKGMDFFQPEHYGPNIYKLENFQAHDGVYRLKAREVIYEASFFDKAELLIVDVPIGHEVFNTWSFTSQLGHESERRFVSTRDLRPPIRATDDKGRDVLKQISRADDRPLPVAEDGLSRVELDFGPIEHPEHAKLIITAWGHYADLRGKQKPPYAAGTSIETLDENGKWRIRMITGKAAGDARSWAVDIGGLLKAEDGRLRITMAHLPSVLDVLDAVRLDDSKPVPIKVTRLSPRLARLQDEGAASVRSSTLKHSIEAVDDHLPPIKDAMLTGHYTRFGEVGELIASSDDRFVIMVHGDSLLLEFKAVAENPLMRRLIFLEADVFYTLKYHPFGQVTSNNEPLPFHGMTRYPYDFEDWPHAKDEAYLDHLKRWQTRKVLLPKRFKTLSPPDERKSP
ncbi:MAG: hypothetical protein JRF33_13970 [Deltaproteobacteria bacterium]|nr:hypothetical protein [Deltaproteobacteria bacterium]